MNRRRARPAALAALLALALALVVLMAGAALASAEAEAQLGPKPAKCGFGCWADAPNSLAVSRLGDMDVSPHIIRVGQTITAKFHPLPGAISWSWPMNGKGCHKKNSTTCTFKPGATGGWAILTLGIGNAQGAAESQDAYAVLDKGTSVVEGYVRDRSDGGVPNIEVTIRGSGGIYHVRTGGDGFYDEVVKPGRYEIEPSGGPGRRPRYEPAQVERTVEKGANLRADFVLQSGLEVKLTLDRASVPADGFQIVHATLTTTRFGKPAPNVTVSLRPQEKERAAQALAGPRAALCQATGGGVIWPTGGLAKADGVPVDVTTDATGRFSFTLDAGTVPGSFALDAWAKDGFGKLITDDLSAVTDDVTLTMKPVGGATPEGFPQELTVVAGTRPPLLSNMGGGAGDFFTTFTQLSADTPSLGGLGYAHVNSDTGDALLVYAAGSPPHVGEDGKVAAGVSRAIVIEPNAWVGSTAVPLTSLQQVLQQGQLQNVPTFAQFAAGAGGVPGWLLKPVTVTEAGDALQGFGWGYPTPLAGSCG